MTTCPQGGGKTPKQCISITAVSVKPGWFVFGQEKIPKPENSRSSAGEGGFRVVQARTGRYKMVQVD